MILVVPFKDEISGEIYVSHGVDTDTLDNVCLPQEEFYWFVRNYCFLSETYGGYVMKNN